MSAVETYHRLTSFANAKELYQVDPRLLDFEELVPSRMPPPVKEYPDGLPVVELPAELPTHPVPAADVLSGRRPERSSAPLDLGEVARLLFWSAGILRYVQNPKMPRPHYFRAAGSAGNRHPLTAYVVAVGVEGLPDGVWHHDPLRHRLERVGDGPATGPSYLVVTGIPYWDGWKYSERGWRHVWWDAGTMLSHVLALSDSAGRPAALWLDFPDAAVSRLVGADGVQEWPCALVSLGDGRPDLDAPGTPVTGTVDPDPVEFPLVTAAQRATDRTTWGGPAQLAELPPLDVPDGVGAEPLEDVIHRRVSTRDFTPGATVPADVMRWSLAVATRPFRTDAVPVPTTHHVFVLAVDGQEPGLYTWHPDDKAGELRLVRAGDVTDDAYELCVRQGLGSDGSYTVQHCATLDDLLHGPDGERGYRVAQLSAGLVEGRLQLTAFTAGHGATGMTFVDGLLEPLLGVATEGLITTCVGVPSYRAMPGGTPGHPRMMARQRKTRLGDVE